MSRASRQTGEITIADPAHRQLLEGGTINCKHCNAIIRVKPGSACTVYQLPTGIPYQYREVPGAWCRRCGPICIGCYNRGGCRPFELWLDAKEQGIRRAFKLGRFYRFIQVGTSTITRNPLTGRYEG